MLLSSSSSTPPSAAPESLAGRSVLFGIPSLDGKFDYRFLTSLLPTLDLLQQNGVGYMLGLEIGCSLIADARNRIAHHFLQSTHTDLFFIDADISWQPNDVIRLLQRDTPLVGGTYQKKSSKLSFAVKFGDRIETRGDLLTARYLGTGFMRIRRDCLTTLIAKREVIGLKSYRQAEDETNSTPSGDIFAFFDTGIDTYYLGEDYFFCDLWRAVGGDVLLDPTIRLQHIGSWAYDEPIQKYLAAVPSATSAA